MSLEDRVRKIINILNSVEYETLDEIQTKITEAEDEAIKLLRDLEKLE